MYVCMNQEKVWVGYLDYMTSKIRHRKYPRRYRALQVGTCVATGIRFRTSERPGQGR